MTGGNFATWQPEYAARGVTLFPVTIDGKEKRPAVRNYMRLGAPGSRALAAGSHAESLAFGFAAGERSRITVLDIDSADENELADAMSRHGESPLVVKSSSGGFHAYYRHSGEARRIRPMAGKPVDILGGGFAVAPPSRSRDGRQYQIIAGTLDDLARLPPLRGGGIGALPPLEHMGEGSGRNDALFKALGRQAKACDDFAALLDVAAAINSEFGVPLDDAEVTRTSRSVWNMEAQGRNRFGSYGAWFENAELSKLLTLLSPQAFALLAFIKAQNGPAAQFIVADALQGRSEFVSWSRRDIPRARGELIRLGFIVPLTRKAPGKAVVYAWGETGKEAPRTVLVEDMLPKLVGDCQNRKADNLGTFKPIGAGLSFGNFGEQVPKLVGDLPKERDAA